MAGSCNAKRCTLAATISFFVIGVTLFVLGFLVVSIVDNMIDEGVKENRRVEGNADGSCCKDWDADQVQDFIRTNARYSYQVFNVTNLDAALRASSPEKVKLQLTDAWSVQERNYKYNLSFSPDNREVLYNLWWTNIYETPTDSEKAKTRMNLLNPAYIAAVAAARSSSLLAKETSVLLALGPDAFGAANDGLRDVFLAYGGQFLTQTRVGSLSAYLATAYSTLAGANAAFAPISGIANHWLTAKTADSNTLAQIGNSIFSGFELQFDPDNAAAWTALGGGKQLNTAFGSMIWNSSHPITMLTPSGLGVWINAFGCGTTACTATSTPTAAQQSAALSMIIGYMAAAGLDVTDTTTVTTWLNLLGRWALQLVEDSPDTKDYHEFYTAAVQSAFASTCPGLVVHNPASKSVPKYVPGNSANFSGSWAQLGACQFGIGAVTAASNVGRSIFLPCTADLNPRIGCVGPEIYAFVTRAGSSQTGYASGQANLGFNLTVPEARSFLEGFSVAATYNAFAQTASLVPLKEALPDAELWATMGIQTFGPSAPPLSLAVIKSVRDSALLGSATYSGMGFTSRNAAYFDLMVDYVLQYAPNLVMTTVFFAGNAPLLGLADHKTGLFSFRSPVDVLFGYTPGGLGPMDPNNDPLYQLGGQEYPGILNNYTSQDDHWRRTNQGLYRQYSGADNIDLVRFYKAWRGYTQIQTVAGTHINCLCPDLSSTCNPATCLTQSPAAPIYTSPEIIDGVSTGGQFPPFTEGADNRAPDYTIWGTTDFYRNLKYVYQKDVEWRGITLRRYVLSQDTFLNQSQLTSNTKYHMLDPQGLVNMKKWNQDVPLVVSRPRFWQADARLHSQFDLLDSAGNPMSWDIADSEQAQEQLQSYIDVEPLTGSAFRGANRVQYNVKLTQYSYDNPYWSSLWTHALTDHGYSFSDWPAGSQLALNGSEATGLGHPVNNGAKLLYWPALIAEYSFEATDEDIDSFNSQITDNRELARKFRISGLTVGAVLVLGAAVLLVYKVMDKESHGRFVQSLESKKDVTSSQEQLQLGATGSEVNTADADDDEDLLDRVGGAPDPALEAEQRERAASALRAQVQRNQEHEDENDESTI